MDTYEWYLDAELCPECDEPLDPFFVCPHCGYNDWIDSDSDGEEDGWYDNFNDNL